MVGWRKILFKILNIENSTVCVLIFGSKIGEEQSAEDAEDGPPELLVSITFTKSRDEDHKHGSNRRVFYPLLL